MLFLIAQLCNPMSTAGKNYRSVLDTNGDYNNNPTVTIVGSIRVKAYKNQLER